MIFKCGKIRMITLCFARIIFIFTVYICKDN